MLFLDNFAGTFPDYLSAGIALGTLILAIVSFFQTHQIKELSGLVVELSKHTRHLETQSQILSKRYDLEAETALYKKIPNFKFKSLDGKVDKFTNPDLATNFDVLMQHNFEVEIINLGSSAHNVTAKQTNSPYAILFLDSAIVQFGEIFTITLSPLGYDGSQLSDFMFCEFSMFYENSLGLQLTQAFKINPIEFEVEAGLPQILKNDQPT